jgi:hypothetical protein
MGIKPLSTTGNGTGRPDKIRNSFGEDGSMKALGGILLAVLLGLVCGCSSMDVKTDYDPNVNFARMKTFHWLPEKDLLESRDPPPGEEQTFIRDCVQRAVNRELASKGMKQDAASPDVLLTFSTASRDKLQLEGSKEKGWTFKDRLLYPGWIEGNTEIYYDIGTLIVDMVNPRNLDLVWRGSAEASILKDIDRKTLEKNIDEAVRKLLEKFPPAPAP